MILNNIEAFQTLIPQVKTLLGRDVSDMNFLDRIIEQELLGATLPNAA